MGEILGIGLTHYPGLTSKDEHMGGILKRVLQDPGLPEQYRRPEGWPEPMRQEYGSDEGLGAARRHREALVAQFRKARQLLHDFAPDVVVIWGDDQYENFKEDIVPPFCVLAYESFETRPWEAARGPNAWDEPKDKTFAYGGHPAAAKFLANGLLEAGFDVAYAYRPLHHPLGHAFLTPKHHLLYPDVEADRALYEALRVGDYKKWRHTPLASIEESGQQEMLNWMCLVGAMAELERRADETELIQTYLFNSSKCFAFFKPGQ